MSASLRKRPNCSDAAKCREGPLPDSCTATKRRARLLGLFDHLVGAHQERFRDFQAERLGGLQVDHQFELGRRLDRQVGRLLAAQNAVDIGRRAAERIDIVRPVGQQAAAFRELPEGYIAGTRCCAASRTISSRCVEVKDSGTTMRPPPGRCPSESRAASMSPVLRTCAVTGSTESAAAADSNAGSYARPCRNVMSGFTMRAARTVAGAISFKVASHLPPRDGS